jgi:hypothetical protein
VGIERDTTAVQLEGKQTNGVPARGTLAGLAVVDRLAAVGRWAGLVAEGKAIVVEGRLKIGEKPGGKTARGASLTQKGVVGSP